MVKHDSCSKQDNNCPSISVVVMKFNNKLDGNVFNTDKAAIVWSVWSARDKSILTDVG